MYALFGGNATIFFKKSLPGCLKRARPAVSAAGVAFAPFSD